MPIPTPLTAPTDLVSISIAINGKPINDQYSILAIHVENEVNSIPYARVQILDDTDLAISNSGDCVPGNKISIDIGYQGKGNKRVFNGVIVKQALNISTDKGAIVNIECRDLAIRMTIGRKNALFQNKSDSDILSDIISNYALDKAIAATSYKFSSLMQYNVSDWDFILARAGVNGQVVTVDQGKITIQKPDTTQKPVLNVGYGDAIIKLDIAMDAATQLNDVQYTSWDMQTQSVLQADGTDPKLTLLGNIGCKNLASVVAPPQVRYQAAASSNKQTLQTRADAVLIGSQLSKITGKVLFIGNALIKAGALIELSGLGNRYNGNAFVSSVKHNVGNGNWYTEVQLGLSPEWSTDTQPLSDVSGLTGFQNGFVMQVDNDPDNGFRVLIKIPLITNETGVWARMVNPYASNNAGFFFYPEVGDEVLVGFLNNDTNSPVIVGSMYSNKKTPPFTPNSANTNKAIVTKSKLGITFDDVKKTTRINTPANNEITVDDDSQSISIRDQHNNSIIMSSSGIAIKSSSAIQFSAVGDISINANGGNIKLAASQDVGILGMNFNANADLSARVKGAASAELSTSGEMVVKGSMVMIN